MTYCLRFTSQNGKSNVAIGVARFSEFILPGDLAQALHPEQENGVATAMFRLLCKTKI
jgi:hypothetical protein